MTRALEPAEPTLEPAEVVREYGPFPGVARVHGVTFDGAHIWFAAGEQLYAIDPHSGQRVRSLQARGTAGSAFDGRYLYQLADGAIHKLDPASGAVLAVLPTAANTGYSGLAWAEGMLWVGEYRQRKIHQIDPNSGAIVRSLDTQGLVTGVTWLDGELWHGMREAEHSELRRLDARTGRTLERLAPPQGTAISGLESDGRELFFCGDASQPKLRALRRPRRKP